MAITQSYPQKMSGASVKIPLWVDSVVLGAGTAESYVVPANAGYAIITCNSPIYVCVSGTAVVPTTEVTDGTASFYLASGFQGFLESGATVSFIRAAASSTIITIGVYRA